MPFALSRLSRALALSLLVGVCFAGGTSTALAGRSIDQAGVMSSVDPVDLSGFYGSTLQMVVTVASNTTLDPNLAGCTPNTLGIFGQTYAPYGVDNLALSGSLDGGWKLGSTTGDLFHESLVQITWRNSDVVRITGRIELISPSGQLVGLDFNSLTGICPSIQSPSTTALGTAYRVPGGFSIPTPSADGGYHDHYDTADAKTVDVAVSGSNPYTITVFVERPALSPPAPATDPCHSRYPTGRTKTIKISGGTAEVFDRQASLYQVCEGFGAPDSSQFRLTPTMQCAIIAAAATFGGPIVSAGVSKGCSAGSIVTDLRTGNWLGAVKSVGCAYFSDVFAKSAALFAAGATSATGPGAVAVGVATYQALTAGMSLVCGGVLTFSATQFGYKLESNHETAVAIDIIRSGKCLHQTSRRFFGIQWSAVTCTPV
jgi:hypothetical protein